MTRCGLNRMTDSGFFSEEKLNQIEAIAEMYSYAPIKAALNFGFLTRKDYVAFLEKENFPLIDVRNEEIDLIYIEQGDILTFGLGPNNGNLTNSNFLNGEYIEP